MANLNLRSKVCGLRRIGGNYEFNDNRRNAVRDFCTNYTKAGVYRA